MAVTQAFSEARRFVLIAARTATAIMFAHCGSANPTRQQTTRNAGEGQNGRQAAAGDAASGDRQAGDANAPSPDGRDSSADGEALPDAAAPDAGDAGAIVSSRRIVGGYYPNWTPSPVRIRDVDTRYNLIYLFAATPVGGAPGTTGAVEWKLPGDGLGAATNFNADVAFARMTQGRKIILSVGGAGNGMSFPTRTKSQAFVESVASLFGQLGGFDGIDWDTFEGKQAPDTNEMIWISLTLKGRYSGFLITAPPAPWDKVGMAFCAQMASAGALDYCAPQYYDGPGLAAQSYVVGNIDQWATLLGEDKVVVGFGVANQTNYMTIDQAVATWRAVHANHPNLRGVFDWQIHVDQSSGWPFAEQIGPMVSP